MIKMRVLISCLILCFWTVSSESPAGPVVLWSNNEFPLDDPLKNFHPLKSGYFGHGSLFDVPDPAGSGQNVIRVFYRNGSYSQDHDFKGLQFYSMETKRQDALTLSYDVYFEPNFDFAIGGKLPGLFGGLYVKSGQKKHLCSGGRHSEKCFSARLMWREDGFGEIYVYIPDQATGFCNRTDVVCFPLKGTSLGRNQFRFPRGVWTTITEHIKMNTVGQSDGLAKIWLNETLVYTADNIMWRVNETVKIDGMFFSTFFGGGSPMWAARQDSNSYFKNFTISTGGELPIIG